MQLRFQHIEMMIHMIRDGRKAIIEGERNVERDEAFTPS